MQRVQGLLRVSLVPLLSRSSSSKAQLTLYTKDECCLCDEAKLLLKPYMDKIALEEVDITKDTRLFGLYRYEIPVFYLNKKFLCKNRLDVEKLQHALEEIGKTYK